jgi:acyl carrier protein
VTNSTASVEQVVREALKTVRPDVGEIPGNADLAKEIGLDSVQVMDMVMEIEDRLDISVPVETLADSRTIDQLAAGIRKVLGAGK